MIVVLIGFFQYYLNVYFMMYTIDITDVVNRHHSDARNLFKYRGIEVVHPCTTELGNNNLV